MEFEAVFNDIAQRAESANAQKEGDYYVDGLLFCGVCRTPKQMILKVCACPAFSGKKVFCACKCVIDRREAQKRARQKELLESRRIASFTQPALCRVVFDRDDDPDSRLSKLCRGYVNHFDEMYAAGKGMLLYGGVGVGKTFYAACVANALIDRGKRVFFTGFADLDRDRQRIVESEAAHADLMVIDDLGAERDTGYMEEIVHRIINIRALEHKPLLVTTNIDAEQFEHPGSLHRQRIFSRLYDLCLPFRCLGDDKRKQRLKNEFSRLKALLEE